MAFVEDNKVVETSAPEGANLKGLAEYRGTSVQVIEQSYGRYIRKDFLRLLIAARPKTPKRIR
jgi:hypothetical protein